MLLAVNIQIISSFGCCIILTWKGHH